MRSVLGARHWQKASVSGSRWPTRYEIRVDGIPDDQWADWFGGLQLSKDGTQTIIVGLLPDAGDLAAGQPCRHQRCGQHDRMADHHRRPGLPRHAEARQRRDEKLTGMTGPEPAAASADSPGLEDQAVLADSVLAHVLSGGQSEPRGKRACRPRYVMLTG